MKVRAAIVGLALAACALPPAEPEKEWVGPAGWSDECEEVIDWAVRESGTTDPRRIEEITRLTYSVSPKCP